MTQRDLTALADLCDAELPHRVLRFSVSDAGHYQWGSVRTDCMKIAGLLCAMWNNRRVIAAALRSYASLSAREHLEKQDA